ncbi:S8 family peptidase [Streptomyces sp. NBC_01408]|uniref:S8 family peptidase n=1 Tax=Streptomyces sp. NBC_01408 TaxID=2903855 RepID=UPI00225A1136|nr:S8 family peptidase [Streptomyces sp. NBC_01408]MCX4695078.1 S8 family peptidase [Streptomyces sp. NBC_01408]
MTAPRRCRRLLVSAAVLAAAALPIGPTVAAEAAPTGELQLAGPTETAIPDSWIVVLREPAGSRSARSVHELLDRADGARLGHVYRSALNGFSARMSRAQAARLAADPRVARVHQDTRVTLDAPARAEAETADTADTAGTADTAETAAPAATQPNAPWGLDRIDQRLLPLSTTYTYRTTAPAVRVYVIDTGLRTTHAEFGGRASVGTDTVGDGRNGEDCHGHGTHVAGIAAGRTYGVAKEARPVAVRVLNCQGSASTSGVVAGVDWVTANAVRPAVANMSLGGAVSTVLDTAVRNSIRAGITYTASAGSSGRPDGACSTSPARVPETIAVGASDRLDRRASSSNYGACVALFAPGVAIPSAWKDSDTATATLSGTSAATAHTAGAAALHLARHPAATPGQVKQALVAGATTGVLQGTPPVAPDRLLHTLYE